MSTPDFPTDFNRRHLNSAYAMTLKYLQGAPGLAARIDQIAFVVNQVLSKPHLQILAGLPS